MNRGAVMALLIGLQAILLAAHDDPPEPEPSGETVRVMTYNIHQTWPGDDTAHHNLAAVAQTIREADPHIVALQETEASRITSGHIDAVAWLAHELGMHAYRGPPASEGTYGVAILSTWRLTDTTWSHLPHPDSVERVLVRATVHAPQGAIPVFATHFGVLEVPGERLVQAGTVVAASRDAFRPVVLGDFNTPPDEPPYAVLAASLTDAWATVHGDAPASTVLGDGPQVRIDHVFVRDWQVLDAWHTGDVAASDHAAVVAELAWPVSRSP